MINLQRLHKVYRTDELETTALNRVSLQIETAEFVAIMGPSGCGKSSLLNLLGLLDTPSDGQYFLNGQEVGQLSEKKRAAIRKSSLGFVFQSFNLIDELTVAENIALPLIYLNMAKDERVDRVNELLGQMELLHRRNHYPQQLSGGQQQRVAIARAVAGRPHLLLADEPTGNLDTHHGREVMQLLQEMNRAGTTIVMVTHNPEDAAFAHRRIEMIDGSLRINKA
jgi:putative ABC transport system ATP-binding protein